MNYLTQYLCFFSLILFGELSACTGIVQKSEDGSWVYARTMEFGVDLVSYDLQYVPRGIEFQGQADPGNDKSQWTNKFAYVGFNPFGINLVVDGMNEKGLSCGGFYFPGWAKYQDATSVEFKNAISNIDLVSWILGNYSTVPGVLEALKRTKVVGVIFGPWKIIPPLHYIVVDASGEKAVIEYVDGKLNVYPMQTETITNSPPYDWHLLNARNYIGLSDRLK
jgi:choloylglycine hydrolase